MTRPDPSRAEGNRGQRPCFANESGYPWRQSRCAGITGFETVQSTREIAREMGWIDSIVSKYALKVRIRILVQLYKQMFNVDIIVSSGQTQTRSRFEAAPARVVQFPDKTLQIDIHAAALLASA
jgi:hypothetical protein